MLTVNSAYDFTIEQHDGRNFLIIEDLFNITPGDNIKTVTNNIENVVEEIAFNEKIDAKNYLILYKDTDDDWSMWDYFTETHIPGILTKNKQEAIYLVLLKLKA